MPRIVNNVQTKYLENVSTMYPRRPDMRKGANKWG